MRRKVLWLAVGLMLSVIAAIVVSLVVLVQHEPSFYRRAALPPGPQRAELSKQFEGSFAGFVTWIKQGGDAKGNWGGKFCEAGINSYLAEDFVKGGLAQKLLPDGVSDVRFVVEKDRIRLGFRYGDGSWSTIIGVAFRVWLAQNEQNGVVLELESLHAGARPI